MPTCTRAAALTRSIAQCHRNVPVQGFHMRLDFSRNAMGARLAEGDYIAVQIPETFERVWSWDDRLYHCLSPWVGKRAIVKG